MSHTRVLGIDPGYGRIGIAVVEKEHPKEHLIFSDCLSTPKEMSHSDRLRLIGERLDSIITEHEPTVVGVESIFFTKNQKTVIQVAQSRGVVLYIAAIHSLAVHDISPPQIKLSLTGSGRADKQQVAWVAANILGMKNWESKIDDEMDAIAVALTLCTILESPMTQS